MSRNLSARQASCWSAEWQADICLKVPRSSNYIQILHTYTTSTEEITISIMSGDVARSLTLIADSGAAYRRAAWNDTSSCSHGVGNKSGR